LGAYKPKSIYKLAHVGPQLAPSGIYYQENKRIKEGKDRGVSKEGQCGNIEEEQGFLTELHSWASRQGKTKLRLRASSQD
jgi:hypothetical protein